MRSTTIGDLHRARATFECPESHALTVKADKLDGRDRAGMGRGVPGLGAFVNSERNDVWAVDRSTEDYEDRSMWREVQEQ